MESGRTTEDEDTTVTNKIIAVEDDALHNTTGIGTEALVVKSTVILKITVGHTDCVPIWTNNPGPRYTDTIRTRCGEIICWGVRKTAPDRSGQYLLVKLM